MNFPKTLLCLDGAKRAKSFARYTWDYLNSLQQTQIVSTMAFMALGMIFDSGHTTSCNPASLRIISTNRINQNKIILHATGPFIRLKR